MAASLGGEGMGAATSIRTRTVVISGLLVAIQLLLAFTGLGLIPMPTGTPATILHVPTVVAGALAGPLAGFLVGAIFGITSWMRAADPAFVNPLVSILPRLFPGVVAWLVFAALQRVNLGVAAAIAAIAGTLTNTVLVLTMAVVVGPGWPIERALAVAATNVPGELIVATVITTAVVLAVAGGRRARRSSV